MRATDPNNSNNNNRYRGIVSTAVGITTGTIAGVTTDRIISRNQQNNQTPGTTEHYRTGTTGVISDFMIGAERTVDRTALPQEALVHLKRRTTQTNKEVEASAFSPASRETQTTYEEDAKVHLPLSTSGLVVGAIAGLMSGVATYVLLGDDDSSKGGSSGVITSNINNSLENQAQEATALSQLSEEERRTFQQFRQPDPGRLSPVSKFQCEHYKKIHDTTRDKNELLEMKFKLHDLARRNMPDDESID